MGGGSIQTVVGVVKLNFEMHLASAVVKQVVTTEEYDSIRASYKENKKRVLYSGATQLFFSVMLFTVGMINIVDGTDELLLFFAAPFQAVGGMLALLAAHMGKDSRQLCKATQMFSAAAMVLAELSYRWGMDPVDNKVIEASQGFHTALLFISSYVDMLTYACCAYFNQDLKKLSTVQNPNGEDCDE